MSSSFGHTLGSTESDQDQAAQPVARWALYRLLEADRPMRPAFRHSLRGISSVEIGRGPDAVPERRGNALRLRHADRWMSSEHARLEHSFGRWRLLDLGSKNGTRIAGETIDSHALEDGDIFEVGHTFFMLREHRTHEEFGDLGAGELREPAFATLSPALAADLGRLRRLAATPVSILILGESGTGKEVTARALHDHSGRPGELVGVNCGALPEALVESELFGHKKGAFSGAAADHTGLVRSADRGTLFLDEVGDLPAPSQASLLRVLQEREVRPVGSTRATPVDVRVLSATHRDLESAVDSGGFRRDLFARLAGYTVSLSPLRQRREDLGLLIAALLRKLAAPPELRFQVAAARALLHHAWPLNVRGLENCLTTALALAGSEPIGLEHLDDALRASAREGDDRPRAEVAREERDGDEALRAELRSQLRAHGGNISAVARAMGKDRRQIHRWIKRLRIETTEFR